MGKEILFIVLVVYFIPAFARGQDLENIGKSKAIKLTGGINTSTSFNAVEGAEMNRDPYFWMLNANINFCFFGIVNAPFSMTLAKENQTYNQPSFREYGISPNYKGVTLHLGYRNMSFSSYSLSGITFFGAGVEVKPEKTPITFSAMYGRFHEAHDYVQFNQFEVDKQVLEEPSYKRMGFGAKIGYAKKVHAIEFLFFRAWDVNDSIDYLPETEDIKPEENLIFGFNGKTKIFKNLSLNFEFTNSTYTQDSRLPEIEYESYTYLNNIPWLFTPRISTFTRNAFVGGVSYQLGKVNFGGGYRRVDPGYKSMGTPVVSSDIENITLNASASLFKEKANLAGNIGKQRNNLDNQLPNTMQRLIGSLIYSMKVTKATDFSINYSNFSSNTIPVSIAIVDSIKYVQTTENLALSANFNFGKEENKQGLNFTADYQTVNSTNRTGTDTLETNSKVYGANLAYITNIPSWELNINVSANYSSYISGISSNQTFGPTFGISKSFIDKKLKTNFLYSFFMSCSSRENNTPVNNFNLNLSYQLSKNHSFRFNARYMQKIGPEKTVNRFQGTISYNYTL